VIRLSSCLSAYALTGQGGLTIILASILGLSPVSGRPDISITPRTTSYRSRRQGVSVGDRRKDDEEEEKKKKKKKKKRRKRTCKFRYPRQFPQ